MIGFLAPFRAHRATAASDIIHHVAVDDLRRSLAAAARKMSVYVWTVSGENVSLHVLKCNVHILPVTRQNHMLHIDNVVVAS